MRYPDDLTEQEIQDLKDAALAAELNTPEGKYNDFLNQITALEGSREIMMKHNPTIRTTFFANWQTIDFDAFLELFV